MAAGVICDSHSFPTATSTADAYQQLMLSIVSHYDEQPTASACQRSGTARAKPPGFRAPTVRDVLSNRLYENVQFGELLIL